MKYVCLRCGFDAKQKINLERHLNRKNICIPILEDVSIEYMRNYYNLKNKKMKQVKPALEQFQPGKNQLEPALDQFYQPGKNQVKPGCSKISNRQNQAKTSLSNIECEFCGKNFTRTYGLTCHLKVCPEKKKYESDKDREIDELKKNYCELQKTVEILINEKKLISTNNTNNTNCNNTTDSYNTDNSTHNTININNYGCENKDYITKDYLIKLLKTPFQAIPKLIEYTHFNDEHPENQNIKIPNKKQPYVKVLKDDKWIYADRKSTILDLIDEKHSELNDIPLINYIEKNFSNNLQERFEKFNKRYLNDEKEFTSQLYKETELMMINNS